MLTATFFPAATTATTAALDTRVVAVLPRTGRRVELRRVSEGSSPDGYSAEAGYYGEGGPSDPHVRIRITKIKPLGRIAHVTGYVLWRYTGQSDQVFHFYNAVAHQLGAEIRYPIPALW